MPKIIGLTIGEPFAVNNWSNIPYNLFSTLKARGQLLDAVGTALPAGMVSGLKLWYAVTKMRSRNLGEFVNRSTLRSRYLALSALPKLNSYRETDAAIVCTTTEIDYRPFRNLVYTYMDATFRQAWDLGPSYRAAMPRGYADVVEKREKAQLNRTAGVLAFSNWTKKSLVDDYGVDERKITVVGYGHNLPAIPDFSKRELEQPIILFIATDWVRKGGDIVVKAFDILRSKYHDLSLVVAGRVPEYVRAKEGVTVLGFLSKSNPADLQKMIDYYIKAAVFVLPSIYDTMPNVILEAMYTKTPVVSSNVCAIPEEVTDGETGFVVASGSPEEYAERISLLLDNDEMRWKMGSAARTRIEERFTWDAVADRIVGALSR